MCKNTHLIIMAGGIGSRFWPLSTPAYLSQAVCGCVGNRQESAPDDSGAFWGALCLQPYMGSDQQGLCGNGEGTFATGA